MIDVTGQSAFWQGMALIIIYALKKLSNSLMSKNVMIQKLLLMEHG